MFLRLQRRRKRRNKMLQLLIKTTFVSLFSSVQPCIEIHFPSRETRDRVSLPVCVSVPVLVCQQWSIKKHIPVTSPICYPECSDQECLRHDLGVDTFPYHTW